MTKLYSWAQFSHPDQEERELARELARKAIDEAKTRTPKRKPYNPAAKWKAHK
jgi:hypothetical protein